MATFPIDVVVDPRKAQAGIAKVQGGLTKLEDRAGRVGRAFTAAFAALAGGIGFASGLSTLANYERQMAAVRGVTQGAETQFKALREEAARLGGTTEYSASQVGAAMEFLGRAGFNANQVLGATEGVLTLATAGQLDLARAADITSNVLSGFGLQVSELDRVLDVMAATASSTNTTVEGLGSSFSRAAPLAVTLGIDIETVAAVLGKLGDSGIQAGRAATGLLAVFRGLTNETESGNEVLARYGLTMADLNPAVHGLIEPLRRLAEAGLGLPELLRLFQQEGGPAAAVILRNVDAIADLEGRLRTSDGAASNLARIIRDQLGGSFDDLRSSLEAVIIAFGDAGLTDVVRGVVDAMVGGLRAVARDADRAKGILLGVVAAIGSAIVVALIPAIVSLTTALRTLTLSNPFTLFPYLIGLAVFAVYELRDEIADLTRAFTRWFAEAIATATAGLEAFFDGTWALLSNFGQNLAAGIVNPVLRALEKVIDAYEDLDRSAGGLLPNIFEGFTFLDNLLAETGRSSAEAYTRAFRETFDQRQPELLAALDRAFGIDRGATRLPGRHPPAQPGLPDLDELLRQAGGLGGDGGAGGAGGGAAGELAGPPRPAVLFSDIVGALQQRIELTQHLSDERERATEIARIEDALERDLLATEEDLVEQLLMTNQQMETRFAILDQIIGPQQQMRNQLEEINHILTNGVEGLELTNEQLGELRDRYTEIRIELGEADFLETLQYRLEETFGAVENLNLEIADTIVESVERMSRAVARTFTDFITGARTASEAIRGLFLAAFEAIIQKIIQAQAEALFLAAINAITGLFGGGGGITGTVFPGAVPGPHLARGGLVFPVQAFPAGGLVFGPGGPTQDQVLARVSPGEYVVNAESTQRNRQLLERINRGGDVGAGQRPVQVNMTVNTPNADSFRESRREIRSDLYLAGRRAFRRDR